MLSNSRTYFKQMKTSIARKFVMGLSGLFLVLFLANHLLVNSFTLFSAELFNEASHFMQTNIFIQIVQYVLALGFILHIGWGIALTIQNKKARTSKYAYNKPSANSALSSRSMIITGMLVLMFLVLHIKDFFVPVHWPENPLLTDYDLVVALFANPVYVAIYVVAFILMATHLHHGFQSAFQSIGINHPKYTPILKGLGLFFCLLVGVGFTAIALLHYVNSLG